MDEISPYHKLDALSLIAGALNNNLKDPSHKMRKLSEFKQRRVILKYCRSVNTEQGQKFFLNADRVAPSLVRGEHINSVCTFVHVSNELLLSQREWAAKYLVNLWHKRSIVTRAESLRSPASRNLQLAVSWVSGLDVFQWSVEVVYEYFLYLCQYGELKLECIPQTPLINDIS